MAGRSSGTRSTCTPPSRVARPRCSSRASSNWKPAWSAWPSASAACRKSAYCSPLIPEDAAILELSEQLAESEMTLEELEASEEQQVERLEQLRQQLQQATQAQQQAQGDLQRLNGRLASLEALQQAALDPGTGTAEWLRDQHLAERPRLAEGLKVEAGLGIGGGNRARRRSASGAGG